MLGRKPLPSDCIVSETNFSAERSHLSGKASAMTSDLIVIVKSKKKYVQSHLDEQREEIVFHA